jgi:D-3-phosphoglycerate dehydrogenase
MKIVIPDDYQDCVRHLACFSKLEGHEVIILNDTVKTLEDKVKRFQDADAIVLTRERTVMDRPLIERLPNLKAISQTGKIASHVDLVACQENGIVVMDGHGTGSATAELNILLTLAALRNFVSEVNRLQKGKWQGSVGKQFAGKRLGIYGYGRIGKQLCHIGRVFGAQVWVWGRQSSIENAKADGFEIAPSREAFFAQSDILNLQLRLNPETQHIVTAQDLSIMKPDALLVNASRAELIEPRALYHALQIGRPGFAAVDVYEHEPVLNASDPLLTLANCLCSPHLGFVELDNYETYYGIAFDNINAFIQGDSFSRVV